MDIKKNFLLIGAVILTLLLGSCGGPQALIIPHSVSTANSISMDALNLNKGDYEILNTVTETSSVSVKYTSKAITIKSLDGDFAYWFRWNLKYGWFLKKYSGTASFGYLKNEPGSNVGFPNAEEFARRAAIAKLINVIKDFHADGALEPIVTTTATNSGSNTIEYHATASAKIIKIHATN